MKIEIIKKNSRAHYSIDNDLIISSGYKILRLNTSTLSTEYIGTLPISFINKILSSSKLVRRLLRMGIHHVFYLKKYDSFIAIAGKNVYLKRGNNKFELSLRKMRSRPLPQGVCIDSQDNVYYGEYWRNEENEDVYLYKSSDGGKTWTIQHKFGNENRIRHIHAVQYDHYEDKLWITTGDSDKACGIYFSVDQGKTLNAIGRGDKSWCAVSLIFANDYIYWGTDSPETQNWIYRYHRINGQREQLQEIPGPVYYSTKVGDRLVFATTVEEGQGERDNCVHILLSRDGGQWIDILAIEKDIWPTIFQYGTINFGNCSFTQDLIFNPIGLKRIDGNICRLTFDNDLKTGCKS